MGNEQRKNCPMRHENGNCLPVGGFCTSVNDPICEAIHKAFRHGEESAYERFILDSAERTLKFEQRKLEELRKIHEKVIASTEDTVPVVHGEWTIIEDDILMETVYQCSVCKEEFVTLDDEAPQKHLWTCCPSCGAIMDMEAYLKVREEIKRRATNE